MTQTTKNSTSRPASTEAVAFTDGMLVTAADLRAATQYPLSVMQVLVRSFFGCGIVCGLDVSNSNEQAGRAANPDCPPENGFIVEIAPGVALGCDGFPVEICGKIKLDLSPDPCGCPIAGSQTRWIAIRRVTSAEPSGGGCGCGSGSGCGCGAGGGSSGQQCTRVRDHVLIQAFDTVPAGACMLPPVKPVTAKDAATGAAVAEKNPRESLCDCLQHCGDCDRCADPWVVIAVLEIKWDGGKDNKKDGIVAGSINRTDLVKTVGGRKWVKPIACLCAAESAQAARHQVFEERTDAIGKLDERVKRLEAARPTTPKSPG